MNNKINAIISIALIITILSSAFSFFSSNKEKISLKRQLSSTEELLIKKESEYIKIEKQRDSIFTLYTKSNEKEENTTNTGGSVRYINRIIYRDGETVVETITDSSFYNENIILKETLRENLEKYEQKIKELEEKKKENDGLEYTSSSSSSTEYTKETIINRPFFLEGGLNLSKSDEIVVPTIAVGFKQVFLERFFVKSILGKDGLDLNLSKFNLKIVTGIDF